MMKRDCAKSSSRRSVRDASGESLPTPSTSSPWNSGIQMACSVSGTSSSVERPSEMTASNDRSTLPASTIWRALRPLSFMFR